MVQITKAEARFIRSRFPKLYITKTCKKKNDGSHRGKYYIEENPKALKYLQLCRGC